MQPVQVEVRRGPLVEAVHVVDVAVVRGDETVSTSSPDDRPVYLRSSAKVVQALACVVTEAAERLQFTSRELALAAASHNGEPFHVETAHAMLRKAGLDVGHLGCGAHPPIHGPSRDALAASGAVPTALHNNCSGKHAAMLAACVAAGWPLDDYLELEHPLQQLNLRNVATFAGVAPSDVVVGVDGCSAPVFAVPLPAAARLFLAFADPERTSRLDAQQVRAARTVHDAVVAHPEYLAGTEREDTDVIRETGGRVVCKVGAEGKWCLAVGDAGLGVAVACRDGARRAATAVGLHVLQGLGVLDEATLLRLSRHTGREIRNHRGRVIGSITVPETDGSAVA